MNRALRLKASVVPLVFILSWIESGSAAAAVDLTGRFSIRIDLFSQLPAQSWNIVQSGTTLTILGLASGTIDPNTGSFNLVDNRPICVLPGEPGSIVGTAENSDHFSAVWTTDVQGTPTQCSRLSLGVTAVRDLCSNGVVDAGEQCDGGQCCATNCRFAENGLPCDDDNPATKDDRCVDDVCGALRIREIAINTSTTGTQSTAQVASSDDGTVIVVWESFDNLEARAGEVRGQRFASGGARVGSEFEVNSFTTGSQLYPAVATSPAGFLVVWQGDSDQDGSDRGIFAQRYTSAGERSGTEFQVNAYTTSAQVWPDVAMDAAGNALVAWSDFGQQAIMARRFDSSGSPIGSEFPVNDVSGHSKRYPAIAPVGENRFVVVWNAMAGTESIRAHLCDETGPVGSDFVVTLSDVYFQARPAVAAVSTGEFLVTWAAGRVSQSIEILGRQFTDGVPLGAAFVVNRDTLGNQSEPAVSAQPDGTFLVLWTSPTDGESEGVFGQRVASDGAFLGTELRLNTYGVGGQSQPAAAPALGGRSFVTWTDFNGLDGDGLGVFGRIVLLQSCLGDCDDNGVVSVDELVTGINIALGRHEITECSAFDDDGDQRVVVNELVDGVNNLLHTCGDTAAAE